VMRCARPGRNFLDNRGIWLPDQLSIQLLLVSSSFLHKAKRFYDLNEFAYWLSLMFL
jgi:hypothetical protein